MDGLMPTGADGQAAVGTGVVTNPGGAERQQRKRKPAHRDEQLESLQEASRQRILPLADPAATPASGRSLGELAALFNQSADFSAQPAGGDPKVLSPTAAVTQGKAPKRSRGTPSEPAAGRLQMRHVTTLPEVLKAQAVEAEAAYAIAEARGQGEQWLEENAHGPLRAGEANKPILALMRQTAATARGAEAQEPDAATDVFTRVHAAADVLNIQRAGSADGLPSGSLEHFAQEIGQQKARSGRRQLL